MTLKTLALAAASILAASPALAAHHKASTDPILNHSGPVSYSELQQMDSGTKGYNARAGRHHAAAAVAPAAADAAAPAAPASTAAPSVASPAAAAVNPPAPTDQNAPSTATGQVSTPPGQSAAPAPLPSSPSSPTLPSTPQ